MKRRTGVIVAVVLSVAWAAGQSDVDPGRLLDRQGLASVWAVLAGFARPDLAPEFLARIARLALESLLIGVLGTALAAIAGFGLAMIGTRVPQLADPPRGSRRVRLAGEGIRLVVRGVLGVARSIPDIVWAYLFVRLLGLGPGSAVLAIAIASGGSMGKLFAELAEAVDPGPVHALRRAGAGRLGVLVHGVLPQVQRPYVAYGLFRLECAIRSASILGIVGAGGLGTEIALSIRYFQFDKLATALCAVLVFVIAIEAASAWLRRRRIHWTLGLGGLGAAAALAVLDVPWADLWRSQLWPDGGSLRLGADALDIAVGALPSVIETVAMAWCATIAAAVVAFLAAPLATRALMTGSYLSAPPPRRGAGRVLAWLVSGLARTGFQVCRAMPELTLALLFVIWIGPGPFAGVLAIGVYTVGVLGRLYADVYEEVERGPVGALEAAGAGRLAVWAFAVVPQVAPRVLAFTLYRFEVNVRMTAMIGFVGAGGIGDRLHTAINLFHVTDLVALLGVLIAVVTAIDVVGDRLRYRILVARFGAQRAGARRSAPSRIAPHASPDDGRRDPHDLDERRDVVRLLAKRPD